MRRGACVPVRCRKFELLRFAPGSPVSIAAMFVRAKGLVVDLVELGVVEQVEQFPFEVKAHAFVDGETLGKASVEVQAAREIQGVAADSAVG